MDIFSHGLWATAAYKAINKKSEKQFQVWLAAWWGVFPDIFAFALPFSWMAWSVTFGEMSFADFPRPSHDGMEPASNGAPPLFALTSMLYRVSHSVIIFCAVFALVHMIFKKPAWELGGWLIHILMDIPTHSYRFFPTPFLWPLSEWKFNGFSWGTPRFLIPNYLLLLAVFFLLRGKRSKSFEEKKCSGKK